MSNSWILTPLGQIAEFRNGLNYSEKNDGAGLPIVKVKDFGDRHFVSHETLDEINPTGLTISDKQLLRRNDIVIVRSNGNKDLVGRSMIYQGPDNKTAFAGFCIRGRVDQEKASPQFIHYWLRAPSTRERFGREGSGTGIQNVSQGLLQAQPVLLPPLNEQREIAAILGALDDKIELNRKTAATLEAMARALYRSWFVDFDPVHAKSEGRPPAHMNPTTAALFPDSFGEDGLPVGWVREPLSRHLSVERGLSYKGEHLCEEGEGLPMHNLNSIFEGGGYKVEGVKYYKGEYRKRHEVQPGDLIIANTEQGFDLQLMAHAALIPSSLGPLGLFSQHIYKVTPKGASPFTNEWLYLMMSVSPWGNEIRGYANGTTVNMLPVDALEIPDVPVPPRNLVSEFTRTVRPMFAHKVALEDEARTLATLRDTLLPRLMSGDLRVGEAREQVEAVA